MGKNVDLSFLVTTGLLVANSLMTAVPLNAQGTQQLGTPPVVRNLGSSDLESHTVLNTPQLEQKWRAFAADKGWSVLRNEMKRLGYARITGEKNQWGFEGVSTDKQSVLVCVFDFQSKAKGYGSLVWYKNGLTNYKAYLLLPQGREKIEDALEQSTEHFVDSNMQLKKANSFGRCLTRRLRDQCGARCLASAVGCAVVPSLAGHLSCVALICGSCVVFAALSCGINI